jgi:2-haloacid dehalogenase
MKRFGCGSPSNGLLERAMQHAGLAVDHVRSVDEVGVYKPDPRVYAMLTEMAPAEATLFVSSNGFDADGAKRCGHTVCFIERATRPAADPDMQVRSLAELAEIDRTVIPAPGPRTQCPRS